MEFITAEQFLEQPKEVQKVFKEYFDQKCMLYSFNNVINYGTFDDILDETPILIEGQLRKFIEDKTGKVMDISYYPEDDDYQYSGYIVQLFDFRTCIREFESLGDDLLQSYWKVALKVAKESIS